MHSPHTIAHCCITVELGSADCEEDNVLPDQKRRLELKYLSDVARIAWDS
jgi:hypothetical protein